MSSLDQANAILAERVGEAPVAAVTQLSDTTYINVDSELEALVEAVEAAFPDGKLHEEAIRKAPLTAAQKPSTLWAWRRGRKGRRGKEGYLPSITVSVYASGAVVWQGTEPVYPG
jgi:hypothetical protein